MMILVTLYRFVMCCSTVPTFSDRSKSNPLNETVATCRIFSSSCCWSAPLVEMTDPEVAGECGRCCHCIPGDGHCMPYCRGTYGALLYRDGRTVYPNMSCGSAKLPTHTRDRSLPLGSRLIMLGQQGHRIRAVVRVRHHILLRPIE